MDQPVQISNEALQTTPFWKKKPIIIGVFVIVLLAIIGGGFIASQNSSNISQITPTPKVNPGLPVGPTDPPGLQKPITAQITTFPQSYKDITIPSSLYSEAKIMYGVIDSGTTKIYVIGLITRYYMYRDLLEENKVPFSYPSIVKFSDLKSLVPKMEELIKERLVSTMDFVYIKARFSQSRSEDEAKEKFGDLKKKATEIITKYRQDMIDSPSQVQAILEKSNKDADLMLLNFREPGEFVQNYEYDTNLFFTDPSFNSFVFALPVNKVSNIYTLRNDFGEHSYLIVYPTAKKNGVIESFEQTLQQRLTQFK